MATEKIGDNRSFSCPRWTGTVHDNISCFTGQTGSFRRNLLSEGRAPAPRKLQATRSQRALPNCSDRHLRACNACAKYCRECRSRPGTACVAVRIAGIHERAFHGSGTSGGDKARVIPEALGPFVGSFYQHPSIRRATGSRCRATRPRSRHSRGTSPAGRTTAWCRCEDESSSRLRRRFHWQCR